MPAIERARHEERRAAGQDLGENDAGNARADGERGKGDAQDEHLVHHRHRGVSPHPFSRPERHPVTLRQEQRNIGQEEQDEEPGRAHAISECQGEESDRNRRGCRRRPTRKASAVPSSSPARSGARAVSRTTQRDWPHSRSM